MALEVIWAQLAESLTRGSRSTVLKSILWLFGLLMLGLAAVLRGTPPAPPWVIMLLAGALGLTLIVILGSYIYFIFKDPSALRSETFALQKMAIERGIRGDNLSGIISESTTRQVKSIEPRPSDQSSGRDG